jgi:hypothetical protein
VQEKPNLVTSRSEELILESIALNPALPIGLNIRAGIAWNELHGLDLEPSAV